MDIPKKNIFFLNQLYLSDGLSIWHGEKKTRLTV